MFTIIQKKQCILPSYKTISQVGLLEVFVFVAAEILDEIAKAKFTDPTPIQVRKVKFSLPMKV